VHSCHNDKDLQYIDDSVEFRLRVAFFTQNDAECRPPSFLVCVVVKFGRKGERHAVRRAIRRRDSGMFFERFAEGLSVEREPAGNDRREILHTAVGDAKLNHRLEFFRTVMAPRIA